MLPYYFPFSFTQIFFIITFKIFNLFNIMRFEISFIISNVFIYRTFTLCPQILLPTPEQLNQYK